MIDSHLICSENVENDYIFPADVLSLHITDIGALGRNLFNREQLLAGAVLGLGEPFHILPTFDKLKNRV